MAGNSMFIGNFVLLFLSTFANVSLVRAQELVPAPAPAAAAEDEVPADLPEGLQVNKRIAGGAIMLQYKEYGIKKQFKVKETGSYKRAEELATAALAELRVAEVRFNRARSPSLRTVLSTTRPPLTYCMY
eukprot:1174148-Pyramimonas_sp.AAC.1